MKYLAVASFFLGSCILAQAIPLTEKNIIGMYSLTVPKTAGLEYEFHLPQYLTLAEDHGVDFVFDGEPWVISLCETNWSLVDSTLNTTMDCSSIFPDMKPLVLEFNLAGTTQESLNQARGVEVIVNSSGLVVDTKELNEFNGKLVLTRVQQGPLNLNDLTISSGEGRGLVRPIDSDLGCCLDYYCNVSIPCSEAELSFSDGRIQVRLIFDENIKNLNTAALFQKHLKRVYLSVGHKISSKELEFSSTEPKNIVINSLSNGRLEFTVWGILETLKRAKWVGGVNGYQVKEKVDISIPYDIDFNLEVLL